MLKLFVMTAVALTFVGGATAAPLFENFEDGVADGFTVIDANGSATPDADWQVIDDGGDLVYRQTERSLQSGDGGTGDGTLGAISLAPGSWTDVTISVQLRLDNDNSSDDGGLVWGYQDEAHYYMALFNRESDNNEVFSVTGTGPDDKSRTQIGGAMDYSGLGGVPFLDDAYHDVVLSFDATTGDIVITVDGTQVFAATDTTYTSAGQAGVGAYNDAPYFDDVSIVPEPASLAALAVGAVALIRRKR